MSSSLEIRTPTFRLAECLKTKVHLCRHGGHGYDWRTSTISIPVLNDVKNFPFNLNSSGYDIPKNIEIVITKQPKVPIYTIRVGNFGKLPEVFSRGTLHAVVRGYFRPENGIELNEKDQSMEIKGVEFAEMEITEPDFNFNSRSATVSEAGFEVEVFWKVSFLEEKMAYLDKYLLYTSSDAIQQLEGSAVSISSASGKNKFKISKWLLAVFSSKFKAQFEFDSSVEEVALYVDEYVQIEEKSLVAFIEFLFGFALTKPMESCSIAFDLLRAGHYNMFPEIETAMQNILLTKSTNWFDSRISFDLYCYAIKIGSTMNDENKKAVWTNLKWKALRNLKSIAPEKLKECLDTEDMMRDHIVNDMFMDLIFMA